MSASPHVAAANRYARQAASGRLPAAALVRAACQRHLDDLERSRGKKFPFIFDAKLAEERCEFIELLPHTKGEWAQRDELIVLGPWQCFIVCSIFGWVRRKDHRRRFREAYIEVARKNGKSAMSAAIGISMFTIDGEFGAEVYSGAATEKQAWEVFRPAKQMVERTPNLREALAIEVWAKSLVRIADESRFEPIVGKPGDGASPSCAIIDEYHEHQTPDLYDTMVTGMAARREPLVLIITTAGANTASPCYEKHLEVEKVLDGSIERDDLFGIIYGIDQTDDWSDPAVLRKANPNFGVSIDDDWLRAQQRQAASNAVKQASFKTKNLNVWLNARAGLFNMKEWLEATDTMLEPEELEGCDCWFSLDLASKVDMCAFVKLFRKRLDGISHWYAFAKFYLPQAAIDEPGPNHAHYRKWVIEGHLIATDGATVDYEVIKEDVISDAKRFNPQEIVFDPYNATHMAQLLMDQGLTLVEHAQTPPSMALPADELVAIIKDRRFHHPGHPVMNWMASNTVTRPTKKGLMMPMKQLPHLKIDGPVALIMDIARGLASEDASSPGITPL